LRAVCWEGRKKLRMTLAEINALQKQKGDEYGRLFLGRLGRGQGSVFSPHLVGMG
jgi:hypothetical protein